MFNKNDITNKIYNQMKGHFKPSNPNIIESISGISHDIIEPGFVIKEGDNVTGLFDRIDESNVTDYLFGNFIKALHHQYKFDSLPEKKFAMVCEISPEVQKWLRPAPKQFNLFYGDNKRYIPDFVVETNEYMYLVEVKGEDKLTDEIVLLKRERAIKYCEVANIYCSKHNLKFWKHLFIPAGQIKSNMSFNYLAARFESTCK
jgi:type III restriction enzyme